MKKQTAKSWVRKMVRTYPLALPVRFITTNWTYDYPGIAAWLRELADALEQESEDA